MTEIESRHRTPSPPPEAMAKSDAALDAVVDEATK